MDFTRRRDAALSLVARSGATSSSYAPMLWRAAWSIGLQIPPPHFAQMWQNTIFVSCWIFLGGGFLQTCLSRHPHKLALLLMLPIAVAIGLGTAASYRSDARRRHLPAWKAIQPQQA